MTQNTKCRNMLILKILNRRKILNMSLCWRPKVAKTKYNFAEVLFGHFSETLCTMWGFINWSYWSGQWISDWSWKLKSFRGDKIFWVKKFFGWWTRRCWTGRDWRLLQRLAWRLTMWWQTSQGTPCKSVRGRSSTLSEYVSKRFPWQSIWDR